MKSGASTKLTIAPYGSWRSPLGLDQMIEDVVRLGEPKIDGDAQYWIETRPSEKGRSVLVRQADGETKTDLTPPEFSVRSRTHEYGGGSYLARENTIWFVNNSDQSIYVQPLPDGQPRQLTADGERRFADMALDRPRNRLLSVCEDHSGSGEAKNFLVGIDLDSGEINVLVEGADFYSNPRVSPDGRQMSWLCWNHPNLPWDTTELWVAKIGSDGAPYEQRCISLEENESVFQPQWAPDGRLYFVSDRNDWWNLCRWDGTSAKPVIEEEAECGLPQWVFGMSTYGFTDSDHLVVASTQNGLWRLRKIQLSTGLQETIASDWTSIECVATGRGKVLILAGSGTRPASIVLIDRRGDERVLQRAINRKLGASHVSEPEPISFPSSGGDHAHGFFYPPRNPLFQAPDNEKPPLLVVCHGGPTSATATTLKLDVQFWTSRGFAVLDVNYRGSTGYGREYRQKLYGTWGQADVDDCIHGAVYLAQKGLVDNEKLAIRGGSAGGYTVLSALTFHDTFNAGSSFFGIGDLESMFETTHKFEASYDHWLIGPRETRKQIVEQRSPLNFADQINCPVIFFQGLDDKVVPPDQSVAMVQALKDNNVPVAYICFEGEGHGFRQSQNIKLCYEAELYFFGKVMGFEPADKLTPIEITHM